VVSENSKNMAEIMVCDSKMAVDATPFANFSPFLQNQYLQGLEGSFIYTENFEVFQVVGK